jgi:hypothetical protein
VMMYCCIDTGEANANQEPPVFIVPMNMSLTLNQVATMTVSGQQPGVPFKLVSCCHEGYECVEVYKLKSVKTDRKYRWPRSTETERDSSQDKPIK